MRALLAFLLLWPSLACAQFAQPVQSETTSLEAAIVANGGTVTGFDHGAINQYIFDSKALGLRPLTDDEAFLAAGTQGAALTTYVRRIAITCTNSPTFTANTGITFAASKYCDPSFDYSTNATQATPTSFQVAIQEATNFASSGVPDFGVQSGASGEWLIARGGGSNPLAQMASTTSSGAPTITSSATLVAVQRSASVISYYAGGSLIGTDSAPTFAGSFTAGATVLGGYRLNGTASGRAATIAYWSTGAALTAAQNLNKAAIVQARLDQNGSPVTYVATTGTDNTSCGTPTAQCATVEYGVAQTRAGGIVRVAGTAAAPPTYTVAASNLFLQKAISILPVNDWGFTLTSQASGSLGSGTTVIRLAPANGGTVTLGKFFIDPSLDPNGTADSCVKVDALSTTFSVIDGTRCQHWGYIAWWARDSATKVNYTWNGQSTADDVRSLIEFNHLTAGSMAFGATFAAAVTNHNTNYLIYANADAAGVTATAASGATITATNSLLTSGIATLGFFQNIKTTFAAATFGMSTANGSLRECVIVQTATAFGGTEYDISGSSYTGTVFSHDCVGGAVSQFGSEGTGPTNDPTKQQNMLMSGISITCTARSQSGLTHGIFLHGVGAGSRVTASSNGTQPCGIDLVDKENPDGIEFDHNTIVGRLLGKGTGATTPSNWHDNTLSMPLGGSAIHLNPGCDTDAGPTCSKVTIATNAVNNYDTNNIVLAAEPGSTVTMSGNTYTQESGGTYNSQAWRWTDSSTYATCALWAASGHEAGATCH